MPLRGRKRRLRLSGFHPFVKHISPMRNISPILVGNQRHGRQNTVMRRRCLPCGRAMPPYDGILPAGNYARLGRDE
ncbi:MAG: hypothetical protein LBK61_11250 [Spirochaetaceae bacterium]|nr:hypothetical protein [Spirochaetaceae bacterium]